MGNCLAAPLSPGETSTTPLRAGDDELQRERQRAKDALEGERAARAEAAAHLHRAEELDGLLGAERQDARRTAAASAARLAATEERSSERDDAAVSTRAALDARLARTAALEAELERERAARVTAEVRAAEAAGEARRFYADISALNRQVGELEEELRIRGGAGAVAQRSLLPLSPSSWLGGAAPAAAPRVAPRPPFIGKRMADGASPDTRTAEYKSYRETERVEWRDGRWTPL